MEPFKISIDKAIIENLKNRIAHTRWTDELDNSDWAYGTSKSYLMELCSYWEKAFDWEKQQDYLNSFLHFKTAIDDVGIHYIHHRGEGNSPVPLILIHGWPDSFIRFLKIIPLLTKQDEEGLSFDVIVPSIPGYGFSDIPQKGGMDKKRIAKLLTELMTSKLGYSKFIAHGGDWGGGIAEQMGLYHEENLYGLHLTDLPFEHGLVKPKNPSPQERKYLESIKKWQMTEGAYSLIQGTRPQTLAYGLNDSPVGLAGWMIEKFKSWSDNNGNIEDAFTKDELLINLTIYWGTETINSAIRIYYEAMKTMMNAQYNPLVKLNPFDKTGDKCTVPTAFAVFPKDPAKPSNDMASRFFNIQQWTEFAAGGHFGAMEQPELVEKDIRKFSKQLIELQ
jgi:pimeloyl-ACP methyl ester carboxylesterase